MHHKSYIKFFLLFSFSIVFSVGLINWIVDPMWTFQKKLFFHQYQSDFNEGQQKINLIYFHKPSYETLFIGNSRTTYLDQTLVPNSKAFNLGINALSPIQYNDYISYAQKYNTKPIKQIIMTLDFQSYLSNAKSIQTNNLHNFIQQAESILYRYKLLLSYDTLVFSFKNIRNVSFEKYKKREKTYNKDFVADSYMKDPIHIQNRVARYVQDMNTSSYKVNTNYKNILLDIKNKNKNIQFIVHTSPLPYPIIKAHLANRKNFELYKLWIKDTIDVFGSVHNYMYKNNISENYTINFCDPTHFYPSVGDSILADIFQLKHINKSKSGILINHENYDQYMDMIKKQFVERY